MPRYKGIGMPKSKKKAVAQPSEAQEESEDWYSQIRITVPTDYDPYHSTHRSGLLYYRSWTCRSWIYRSRNARCSASVGHRPSARRIRMHSASHACTARANGLGGERRVLTAPIRKSQSAECTSK